MTTMEPVPATGRRAAASAGLDVMLTDAVAGTPFLLTPTATAGVAAGLVRHPGRVARRVGELCGDLTAVVTENLLCCSSWGWACVLLCFGVARCTGCGQSSRW